MVSIIVAIASNYAIGKNNDLLWHISEDLKFFKRTTSGHPVVMGYNTFLSIGARPLPKRRNIVVSSTREEGLRDGVEYFRSLDAALADAMEHEKQRFAAEVPATSVQGHAGEIRQSADNGGTELSCDAEPEVFIMGGGMLYRSALPIADRLYITEVETVIEDADTFFPEIDKSIWKETSRSERFFDGPSGYHYSFVTYERK